MDGIVAIDKNDVNLSNANMSSHTPRRTNDDIRIRITKDYTYKYLLPAQYAEARPERGQFTYMNLDY